MKLDITVSISNQTIDDIMCTALEGGINYWCNKCEVFGGSYLGNYASEQISCDGSLILYDIEDGEKYRLNKNNFLTGISKYISDYSNCGNIVCNGEVDACEVDAYIADIIIQLAIFGEVVFG